MHIVVAEDEPLALSDALAMLQPFASEHKIAGFSRGIEVLEHAQTAAVDLLIADIRMPGIDGLELIRRLQEQTGDFAAIVLSGHGEFEYAQVGIRLGIVDYLLKPIRTEALQHAVQVALADLSAARTEREQARIAQLAQMLNGSPSGDETISPGLWGIIVTLCENWNGPRTWHAVGLDREFHQRALGGDHTKECVIVDLDGHRRVVVVPSEKAQPAQVKRQALRIHEASRAAGVLVHTAFDCLKPGMEPANALRDLQHRLAMQMRLEQPTFLALDQVPVSTDDSHTIESRQRLAHALAEARALGSLSVAWVEIQKMLEELRLSSATQHMIIQKLEDLFTLVRDLFDEDIGDVPGRDRIEYAVRSCRGYQDLGDWIEEKLLPVLERAINPTTPRELVGKLVAIIDSTYWEDISLQEFAAGHNVSLAYFSRLFKSEMGVTFSEYLTQVRMAKAKELLAHPELRQHEVSTLVGYGDAKYFGQLFRKMVGVSPLEYQRSQQ